MLRITTGRAFVLAVAMLVPACGGGSSGAGMGTPPSPSLPLASVTTPSGSQHSVVPIEFTLIDAESDPISVAIFYSDDGGTTFRPATAAFGSGSLDNLASSPSGTAHTFLWNSLDDAVAAGTYVFGGITSLGVVNPEVQIRVVPKGGTAGTTPNFVVDNTLNRFIGSVAATYPHNFAIIGVSETAEGDLVADAMRSRYGVQLAFQNGWGIREPLPTAFGPASTALRRPLAGYGAGPAYDLVYADIALMLPFGNRVVTRTVTGAQLWAILEQGVSYYPANNNGFPQISGFRFTFKASNPVGSRVTSVTLEGGGAILKDSTTYTFATNDFLNAGGDYYTMLNDGQGVARESLAQVVADWIEAAGTVTPTIAGRITVVP